MRTVALFFLPSSLVAVPGLLLNKPIRWTAKVLALIFTLYHLDVYPVDFLVPTFASNLKYDFNVKSGANSSQTKIEYVDDDKFKSALIDQFDKNSQNA